MRASLGSMVLMVSVLIAPQAYAAVQLPSPTMHANTVQPAPMRPAPQRIQKTLTPIPTHFQISAVMEQGSLQDDIRNLAKQYGWSQVVWDVSNDYEWTGTVNISASNFHALLEKVLQHYPLQAIFYRGNHVLVITSRTPS